MTLPPFDVYSYFKGHFVQWTTWDFFFGLMGAKLDSVLFIAG